MDDQLFNELEKLKAYKNAPSLSAIVIELTKEALEIQEDMFFSRIAEERKSEKTLSHKKLWKIK